MKRMFILPLLISFGVICACEKQDSGAEVQLVQRKAELDARQKALNDREKTLGEWERSAITKSRANSPRFSVAKTGCRSQQMKAERERRMQQLPPELQALIRDRSLLDPRTEKAPATQDRTAELQRRLEEARKKKMNAIASPNPETSDTQTTSPAPSPTPE